MGWIVRYAAERLRLYANKTNKKKFIMKYIVLALALMLGASTIDAKTTKTAKTSKKAKVEVAKAKADSIKADKSFKEKQGLNFILLSDSEHKLAESFKVWKEKSMYGRKYMGIERSTFVLDENLNIIKEWRKVKVKGHVDEVIEYLNI